MRPTCTILLSRSHHLIHRRLPRLSTGEVAPFSGECVPRPRRHIECMAPLEATALLAYYQTAALSSEDPFDLSQARVFTISSDGEVRVMLECPDVYFGLHVLPTAFEKIGDVPVVGVETCGWAAPIEDASGAERAPSEHPRRRCVRLVAVVNRSQEVAAALAFQDDIADVKTNDKGMGVLAEALKDCMDRLALMQSLPKRPDR